MVMLRAFLRPNAALQHRHIPIPGRANTREKPNTRIGRIGQFHNCYPAALQESRVHISSFFAVAVRVSVDLESLIELCFNQPSCIATWLGRAFYRNIAVLTASYPEVTHGGNQNSATDMMCVKVFSLGL